MRVELDKLHKDSYNAVIRKSNKKTKDFSLKEYKKNIDCKKEIENKNTTVQKKKKNLLKIYHNLIIETFSIDLKKIKDKKELIKILKKKITSLRKITHKLKEINYYIEETFLAEIGLTKKDINLFKSKRPEKKAQKETYQLSKNYIKKLEHTTYKLIEKTIIFDKEILKEFKKTEEKILQEKKAKIKDMEETIKKQSQILNHIEAKLPPAKIITQKFLSKEIFTHWVSRIFALLSALKTQQKKENEITGILKNKEKIKKLLSKKINLLKKETRELIKIKQKRLSVAPKESELDKIRILLKDYNSINNL